MDLFPILTTRIEVVITYQDLSTWSAGHFNSIESANAWVVEEQSRLYWDNTWIVTITDLSI